MNKINWVLVFYMIQCYNALYVLPEETILTYFDKKYVTDAFINMTRYGPGGMSWFVNIGGNVKHQWGNNVTVHFLFYQFVNNEYRPSYINVKFKLCDFINKEAFLGAMFRSAKVVCPVPAAVHKISNMTIKSFSNEWPYEKGRLHCELSVTGTKVIFIKTTIIVSFRKENDKKKRRH